VDVRKQVADAPVFSGLNDVALAFFEKPLRFRGLLAQAEDDEIGSNPTSPIRPAVPRFSPGK
jgi:hypothetical protein